MMRLHKQGFTFIEVITALAIVAIAVTALIRLHLISISMTDHATTTTQALLLAQEKIEETLAQSLPQPGTLNGQAQRLGRELSWQKQITDLRLSPDDRNDLTPIRRLEVEVSWKNGSKDRRINLVTYMSQK